jgi:hypothetical protein
MHRSVCTALKAPRLFGFSACHKSVRQFVVTFLPQVAAAVKSGDACFGTIDSWLIYCLTGGPNGGVHVTDGERPVWSTDVAVGTYIN